MTMYMIMLTYVFYMVCASAVMPLPLSWHCPPQVGLSALVNGTRGKATVFLPHSVVAQLQGANHTVKLPPWSLTFDMPREL